jgi:hypothetical protein
MGTMAHLAASESVNVQQMTAVIVANCVRTGVLLMWCLSCCFFVSDHTR